MGSRIIQPSFAAGELTPALYSRVDLSKYAVGAKQLKNFFVHAHGGASNRPGTTYVATLPSGTSKLVPFQYSAVQTYMLVFSDDEMRVVKDGGLVQSGGGDLVVASPYGQEYLDKLKFVQSADVLFLTHPGFAPRELTRSSHTAWTFSTTSFTPTQAAPDNLTGSYNGSGSYDIEYKVSAVSAAGEESLPTAAATVSADTSGNWESGKFVTLVWNSYVSSAWSWTASGSGTNEYYLRTAASGDPGFTTKPAGILIDGSDATEGTVGSLAAGEWDYGDNDTLGYNTVYVRLSDGTDPDTKDDGYIQYVMASAPEYYRVYKSTRGYFGFIGTADAATFRDDNIEPDIQDGPQSSSTPFGAAGDYPGVVSIFEQRTIWGRTDNGPQTIWTSQTGFLRNLSTSRPLKDTDAITATLASLQVNEIKYLVPFAELLVFTAGGEWIMANGSNSDALTPTSVQYKPQGYRGCADVRPLVIGDTVLFVQRGGDVVRDFQYKLETDRYAGNNLSVLSEHLFRGKEIVAWSYAQKPYSIIWVVLDDGTLLSFTYMAEHEVWAWCPQETNGTVLDVATIYGDGEDETYLIVERTVDGTAYRFLEKIHTRVFDDVEDAFFVDCGLTLDNWNAVTDDYLKITGASYSALDSVTLTATGHTPFTDPGSIGDTYYLEDADGNRISVEITAYTSTSVVTATLNQDAPSSLQDTDTAVWAQAVTSISGLDHLIGAEVAILADGNVLDAQTVAGDGTITLDQPAAKVHAGLAYTALMETLSVDFQAEGGTVQGRKKAISKVVMRLENTRGLFMGADEDHLIEVPFRTSEGYDEATRLFTGDKPVTIKPKWGEDGRVVVRQADPLPITVLAIIPEVTLGG